MGAIAPLPFLFSQLFTTFFLILIYSETHIVPKDGRKMMYRDHKEYDNPPKGENHDILKSWLRGETNVDSLRGWLATISA